MQISFNVLLNLRGTVYLDRLRIAAMIACAIASATEQGWSARFVGNCAFMRAFKITA